MRFTVTFQDYLAGAMYQELIAHLEQLGGMTVLPVYRTFKEFNYLASPIEHLYLEWQGEHTAAQLRLLLNILEHYGKFTITTPKD